MSVTLKDFEIRYKNILEKDPKRKRCSSTGCKNPVDFTMLGEDTSCAYHRLLFDFWICDVVEGEKSAWYYSHQKARRAAFTRWQHEIGKEECDKIVLRMALEPINWSC
jgi:hypothetical protein